jgi:hypothetical protein
MVSSDKLILGNIDDDLEINGVKSSAPDGSGNHSGYGNRWRYRTRPDLRNHVFWWDVPTPMQQEAVADFLQRKWHAPRQLKHRSLDDMSWQGADVLHGYQNKFSKKDLQYLKESVTTGNLYVGLITPEFKVVARKQTPHKTGHMSLFPDYHGEEYRPWRFRTDLNTLYWWDTPTDEEKEEVLAWLTKYLGVTQRPKQVVMPTVGTVKAGLGKSIYGTPTWYDSHPEKLEELLNPKANLFLGFIRRDNLKVVGTDVEDEDFTHFHFQSELGQGWMDVYDSDLIPWRYKKG